MSILLVWKLLLIIGELKAALCFCPSYETAIRRHLSVGERSHQHSSSSSENHSKNQLHKNECILGRIHVDYSAANEYIRAHYGDQSPRVPMYFDQEESLETVYDARYGVYCYTNEQNSLINNCVKKTTATLKTCGFTLVSQPAVIVREQDVQEEEDDWNNLEWIQRNRLPQWREHLLLWKELYSNQQRTIRHVLFWNPMLRGPLSAEPRPDKNDKEVIIATPKASYAALPHIDMDVNAYDNFEDFLDLMENNKVEILGDGEDGTHLSAEERRQDILDSIQNKHRGFAIVNAWCNVGKDPVRKDPLGLFSVQYDATASIAAFPMAAPNMKKSHWYAFSDMIPNEEVLFFCQYDRDVSWPSDLWHCSLDGISNPGQHIDLPSRKSFDIRCLIVFEDEVPAHRDRFQRSSRLSSLLSLEESGCFCEGQFEERQKEDTGLD